MSCRGALSEDLEGLEWEVNEMGAREIKETRKNKGGDWKESKKGRAGDKKKIIRMAG